jgi:vitamin B12 transporter
MFEIWANPSFLHPFSLRATKPSGDGRGRNNVSHVSIQCALLCAAQLSLLPLLPASGEDGVENIVVSGVRTPIALGEMSTAVTLIDRETLDLRQSYQLADILRDVPGLTIARSGSVGSQAQVRMRGAEGNHVLVLIDGIEANDPASGDEFLFEHLSALEIERVEVIRGPQSALWGSDAVAGVINIVTRGSGDGFDGGASLEGGAYNSWSGSGRVAWGEDRWSLNLGGGYSESEGTNVSRVGDEDDGYTLATFQSRFVARPSDAVRLDFTARYVEAENETDPVDWVTSLPTDGDRESETTRLVLGANAYIVHGAWSHKTGASWLESDNKNFVGSALSTTTEAERWKLFHQSTVEITNGHRVTAAVDYRETSFTQTGTPSFFGDPNFSQSLTNTGFVLDYVGEISQTVTLTASARYDDNSEFDNIATWRFGGSWAVSGDTRLRGSFGRGQKAPTFGDRFGFTPDTFVGNPDLKPEISDSFEVGVEHSLLEDRVKVGLTYFNAKLQDEINGFFFDPTTFSFTAINKDGESERQGVEVTFDAQISDHLTVSSNYTWTDANEPDDMGGMREEIRRPEHAGALSLVYTTDHGSAFSLNATLVGESTDLDFASFPARLVTLVEYGIVSVAVQTPINDRATLYGRIEKATNSDYENVYGFATPNIGFAAGLRLKF